MSELNDLLKVNHEEAKGGFEPLEVGEYEVIVSEVEIKTSQSGNKMIKQTLTVREDVDQKGQKKKVWDNLVFAPKAAWRVQQAYKAFGFDDGDNFGSVEEVAKALQYKPVRIKVKHETYTNKDGEEKTVDRVDFFTKSHYPIQRQSQNTTNPFGGATAQQPNVKPPFEV